MEKLNYLLYDKITIDQRKRKLRFSHTILQNFTIVEIAESCSDQPTD